MSKFIIMIAKFNTLSENQPSPIEDRYLIYNNKINKIKKDKFKLRNFHPI